MNCNFNRRCKFNGWESHCKICKHNPKAELQDNFRDRGYTPICPEGFNDCIHDPARRLYEYDSGESWMVERYTREELVQDVIDGCKCDEDCYDDEDK